jgi:hypothetical protein
MKPSLADTVDAADVRPRIARWNRDKLDMRKADQIRFNISIARNQLEMRTTESIIWQPYMGSRYQHETEVLAAGEMSRSRTILEYCMQVRGRILFFKLLQILIISKLCIYFIYQLIKYL